MTSRFLIIAAVVLCLAGLIVYSQLIPEPNQVSGFLEADEIRVGSRVGGRVRAVHVEEGEHVEPGQVLVELEPFDLLQREQEALKTLAARNAEYKRLKDGLRPEEIAQAKARYEQLQAQLDAFVAGPRPQEVDAAKGRLQVSEAEQTQAQKNYDRAAELVQNKVVTREEFDAASEKLNAARALVVTRKKELELLEVGTREEVIREAQARVDEALKAWELAKEGFRKEEIDQAEASRDAAQAALDVVRAQKDELTIKSPVAGVVEALDLQPGDLCGAGAPVLSLMDEKRLWVRAYVPQNRVALRPGEKLPVTIDSFGDEKFVGEIIFIARQAEFTPSNVQTPEERAKQVFRIKVLLRDNSPKLRPGMTATVKLEPLGDQP